MALYHSPSIITNGLVYCSDPLNIRSYPGSGTTLYDVSGNGFTGTLTNGPTYSSGYLTYDGVDDRVVTTASTINYPSTTWEAWVYCTQSVNPYNMFMGNYLPYFGFLSGSNLIFSNTVGAGQQTIYAAGGLSLNTWYHTCFTTSFSGGNTLSNIYVNGVLVTSTSLVGQQNAPSGTFTIGDGQSSPSWYPFKGNIGSVKIYNKALSAAEVLQNFNALRGRYGI